MASVPINAQEFCVEHCYGGCNVRAVANSGYYQYQPFYSQINRNLPNYYANSDGQILLSHPPHKYVLSTLVNSNKNDELDLARRICEYVMSRANMKLASCNTVVPLYSSVLNKLADNGVGLPHLRQISAYYEKAIELTDDINVASNGQLSFDYAKLLHNKMNDLYKAEIYYQKAIDFEPTNCSYNLEFAFFLAKERKYYKASLSYWDKSDINGTNNKSECSLCYYGLTLFYNNKFDKSLEILNEALNLIDANANSNNVNAQLIQNCRKIVKHINAAYKMHEITIEKASQSSVHDWLNNWFDELDDDDSNVTLELTTLVGMMDLFDDIDFDRLLQFIKDKYQDFMQASLNSENNKKRRDRNDRNEDEISLNESENDDMSEGDSDVSVIDFATFGRAVRFNRKKKEMSQFFDKMQKLCFAFGETKESQLLKLIPKLPSLACSIANWHENNNENENGNNNNNDNNNNVDTSNFTLQYQAWMQNNQEMETLLNENITNDKEFLSNFHKSMQLVKKQKQHLLNEWQSGVNLFAKTRQDLHARFCHLTENFERETKSRDDIANKCNQIESDYDASKSLILKTFNCIDKMPSKLTQLNSNVTNLEKIVHTMRCDLDTVRSKMDEFDNLMTKYRDFEKKTEENIPKLLERYKIQWDNAEKEWFNWDVNTTVGWFEYILSNNNNNNNNNEDSDNNIEFDFEKIGTTMNVLSFQAKFLPMIDENDLKKYGFTCENIEEMSDEMDDTLEFLCESICDMCEKYPKPKKCYKLKMKIEFEDNNNNENDNSNKNENESNSENENENEIENNENEKEGKMSEIEDKYLCPLTKQPMKNPVMTYDGNTYEYDNIVKYLKENESLPQNNEKVKNVDLAIADLFENKQLKDEMQRNNIKLKIEKEEEEDFDVDLYMKVMQEKEAANDDMTSGQYIDQENENEKDDQLSQPPKKRQRYL